MPTQKGPVYHPLISSAQEYRHEQNPAIKLRIDLQSYDIVPHFELTYRNFQHAFDWLTHNDLQ